MVLAEFKAYLTYLIFKGLVNILPFTGSGMCHNLQAHFKVERIKHFAQGKCAGKYPGRDALGEIYPAIVLPEVPTFLATHRRLLHWKGQVRGTSYRRQNGFLCFHSAANKY